MDVLFCCNKHQLLSIVILIILREESQSQITSGDKIMGLRFLGLPAWRGSERERERESESEREREGGERERERERERGGGGERGRW